MIQKIDTSIIKYDKSIQGLCRKPFYNHPNGCPNFGRKKGCPPGLQLIDNVLDLGKDVYLIYTVFDVGEFAERMRQTHPQWKDQPRQWYNPRRWQPAARKIHHNEEKRSLEKYEKYHLETIIGSPEAYGVNITALMKDAAGITLDWNWPPQHILENDAYKNNKVYRVSLGGYKRSE